MKAAEYDSIENLDTTYSEQNYWKGEIDLDGPVKIDYETQKLVLEPVDPELEYNYANDYEYALLYHTSKNQTSEQLISEGKFFRFIVSIYNHVNWVEN